MPPPVLSPEVASQAADLVRIRREVHRRPGLGFRVEETARLAAEGLRSAGWQVREGVGETGVVGVLRGGRPGRTVLYRADMDGLSVAEETGRPFSSEVPGAMHACGHDAHVAMALGAARALAARRERLPGTVVAMFQPAEEGPGGALPMIRDGLLDDPRPDAAIACHVWNDLPIGSIGVRAGPVLAATDRFEITVTGRGGHGAAPHQTADPIVAAAHLVVALQTLVSRRVSPVKPAVVTVGAVHAGTAFNVIPEKATLGGTVRSLHPEVRETLLRGVDEICAGIGSSHRVRCDVVHTPYYPTTVNDPAVAARVADAAAGVVGRGGVVEQELVLGGEDMAFVLQKVPGCYFFVGTANGEKGASAPHHSSRFDIDEDALPIGAEVLARAVERLLE
ncbi:MAG: amidohydrolase [Planctomycetales bacterium]|nr:amidohydrolase [Planctomycetales bacterium]